MSEMSDKSDQQRAVEDVPELRSVMIRSSAPPSIGRLSPPLGKLSKMPTIIDQSHITIKADTKRQSSSVFRWEQNELPSLPADYSLVRTNVYVRDSRAQVVADRICNELKNQSIFIDTKGCDQKNSLLVETQDGVKLLISLFGQDGMVVVEVRRQAGCSCLFRDAAKAILRSSKNSGQQQRFSPPKKFCIPPMLPMRSREALHECIRDDFRIAHNMLQSEKADAHLLALDTMGKITTRSGTSDIGAKLVLNNNDCTKQLLALIDLYTKDRPSPENESRFRSTQCRKILQVLANACEAISSSDLATILSTTDTGLKQRSFVSFLVSSLNEASKRPHEAFQAARCLRCLLVSKEVEGLLVEMSAIDAVSSANSVGISCHQELEQESFKLMGHLQNVC